jgi:hypothetical protein
MGAVVPTSSAETKIAVPVARIDSRAFVIACVAANSRLHKLYFVVTRKILEMELDESDCHLESAWVVHQKERPGFRNSYQIFWTSH